MSVRLSGANFSPQAFLDLEKQLQIKCPYLRHSYARGVILVQEKSCLFIRQDRILIIRTEVRRPFINTAHHALVTAPVHIPTHIIHTGALNVKISFSCDQV
jgi:hypothetical protein